MGGRGKVFVAVVALVVCSAAVRADGREWAIQLSRSAYWIGWGTPIMMAAVGSASTHEAGRHIIDATLAGSAVCEGLKYVFRQGRPRNPEATGGMPSGQAALAFASATGIGDQYHEWRVPLYLWAAAVGWSRHRLRAHYWHQVVAGAIVGSVVARMSRDSGNGLFNGLFYDDDRPNGFLASPGAWRIAAPGGEVTLWSRSWDF